MGLKVQVSTERLTSLKTLIRQLENPKFRDAARRGLNEHIRLQERQAVTMVSGQTKVPRGRVASISRPKLAGGGAVMEGAVEFRDAAIPLGEYTYRSWSRSAPGATAGDWSAKTYKGSFAVPRWGGRIYRRVSKGRFPIVRVWGPVLPNELRRPDMPALPAAQRLADTDLERRVLRHVGLLLGR